MSYSYKIEGNSDDTPICIAGGKTKFYVSFTASDGTKTPIHYYEVDSEDPEEVSKKLKEAAAQYNDFINSTIAASDISGIALTESFNG